MLENRCGRRVVEGGDEVIRSAVVDYVTNGKHNQIKRSINMLYSVETSELPIPPIPTHNISYRL